MRPEESVESIREWVGILGWLGRALFGIPCGGAVQNPTHVGRESGVGGCSSDGDGDAIAEGIASVVSDDTTSCGCGTPSWNHSHQLTGYASRACSPTLTADRVKHAGEFEDGVVIQCAGCADGARTCGRSDGGYDDRDVVGANIPAVDGHVRGERLDGSAGSGLDSCDRTERPELRAEVKSGKVGVVDADGTADDGSRGGAGDVEIGGKGSSLETRTRG